MLIGVIRIPKSPFSYPAVTERQSHDTMTETDRKGEEKEVESD